MHFESKHSCFKRCIRSNKNFENVTKSQADRHQLLQACSVSWVQLSQSTTFCPELYDGHIRAQIKNFGLNPLNSVVTDKVEVCGTTYVNGMFVLQTYAKKLHLLLLKVKRMFYFFSEKKLPNGCLSLESMKWKKLVCVIWYAKTLRCSVILSHFVFTTEVPGYSTHFNTCPNGACEREYSESFAITQE